MPENIYTVGQLNNYIKNMFSQDFLLKSLSVKGEISNCKYHSSGHIYFTLKDASGSIKAVMFAGNRGGLKFKMEDGMQVVVYGYVDVFVRDGVYQLYANRITQEGAGALYEKFELLKEELAERGMFAEEYKQPIPENARKVGIVTASTGAAVRDIINVSTRRNPYIELILYPAIVQGPEAAPSIVRGIKALEKYGVDVMIVGRGGGSIEDLWAFNEEIVAQAIFDCSVPIISAVGHETDFTIADFVADKRAATPSAAAELAVRELREIDDQIRSRRDALNDRITNILRRKRDSVAALEKQIALLSPQAKIRQSKDRLVRGETALHDGMIDLIKSRRNRLALLTSKLEGSSPLKKLESGFAYVTDEKERRIKSVKQVRKGEKLRLTLTDGYVETQVLKTEEIKNG